MLESHFASTTLDDTMRSVIKQILRHGSRINPSKGSARELTGVLLEITNPRARLSRTETRGKPFSCLGELCWYLAKSNDLEFISYYIPAYKEFADGDFIFGAYGPRLFKWKGTSQLDNVISMLKKKPDTRQAVIQLFDAKDIAETHKDTPCTCTLQFLIRDGKLQMFTNMRSNDAHLGLPHDVFSFTMLQEIVARTLSIEVGTYKHAVGSLHLYEKNVDAARNFLNEGWQPTKEPMPPMPTGDPWCAVTQLLDQESKIRTTRKFVVDHVAGIDPYWADLIRLLQVFRLSKEERAKEIVGIREQMFSKTYLPFIDRKYS